MSQKNVFGLTRQPIRKLELLSYQVRNRLARAASEIRALFEHFPPAQGFNFGYFERKAAFVFVQKTILELKRKLKRNSHQEELRNEEAFLVTNGKDHFFDQLLPDAFTHVSSNLEARLFVSK